MHPFHFSETANDTNKEDYDSDLVIDASWVGEGIQGCGQWKLLLTESCEIGLSWFNNSRG